MLIKVLAKIEDKGRVCTCTYVHALYLQFDLFHLMQTRWFSLKIFFFPKQV